MHYAMKANGGMDAEIHIFLTLALVGGEWWASHPSHVNPGERAPSTHLIGGWVGRRADLDDVERRKFLTLLELEIHHCRPAPHPVTIPTAVPQLMRD
jgi:hypothetical protein